MVLIPVIFARAQPGANAGGIGGTIGASHRDIFNPPQLLWWFGPNAWIVQNAARWDPDGGDRLRAVVARAWPGRSPAAALPDALLLLALVFLARAALDPWNNVYYHVPFLFALIAYEASSGACPC